MQGGNWRTWIGGDGEEKYGLEEYGMEKHGREEMDRRSMDCRGHGVMGVTSPSGGASGDFGILQKVNVGSFTKVNVCSFTLSTPGSW